LCRVKVGPKYELSSKSPQGEKRVSGALFFTLFKLSFIKAFQYRGYILITLFSSIIGVFVRVSLWTALFRANPVVRNTTFHDMITYMALTGLLLLFNMSGAGDRIAHRILQGSISTDLIRPYNLKLYIFSQTTGDNLAHFLLFVLPVYTGVLILFGMQTPPTLLHVLVFIVAVVNGAIISFYYYYILGMLPFWLESNWYIRFVDYAMFTLFAGAFVPIWFYPDFLVKISYYLPFRYITYEAVTFYLGRTGLPEMAGVLLRQLVWIGILLGLEAVLWRAAQKKLTVYGG
jgi:ABC-2 type transport system permease protein